MAETNRDGFRLPAEELEQKVAHVLRSHISKSSFIGRVVPDVSTSAIARDKVQSVYTGICIKPSLDLVERIELAPGQLNITLSAEKLGALLGGEPDDIPADPCTITASFQLRKRGVETKLVFTDAPGDRDQTLIKNIAKAHDWYQQIKAGKTLSEIAKVSNTSNHRVQQMIELAFLAPNIVNDVLDGKQSIGFTSNWSRRHGLPIDWQDQRDLLATL